jgi:hypothetical protein
MEKGMNKMILIPYERYISLVKRGKGGEPISSEFTTLPAEEPFVSKPIHNSPIKDLSKPEQVINEQAVIAPPPGEPVTNRVIEHREVGNKWSTLWQGI